MSDRAAEPVVTGQGSPIAAGLGNEGKACAESKLPKSAKHKAAKRNSHAKDRQNMPTAPSLHLKWMKFS